MVTSILTFNTQQQLCYRPMVVHAAPAVAVTSIVTTHKRPVIPYHPRPIVAGSYRAVIYAALGRANWAGPNVSCLRIGEVFVL